MDGPHSRPATRLSSGVVGVRPEPAGYRFLSYDPEAFLWEDLAADDLPDEPAPGLPEDHDPR